MHRLAEARAEHVGHDARARLLGLGAEQHHVADDVGRVVRADVGELFRAHARDRRRHRRQHQREAFGDPAGMDAGAVQRRVAGRARRFEIGGLRPVGILPADRGRHALARTEDAGHDIGLGEQRRVHDAVGVDRQHGVDVVRRGHADRVAPDQLADVLARLRVGVHPAPDELEVGMVEDALDRRSTDAAGRPLDHPIGLVLRHPPVFTRFGCDLRLSIARAASRHRPSRRICAWLVRSTHHAHVPHAPDGECEGDDRHEREPDDRGAALGDAVAHEARGCVVEPGDEDRAGLPRRRQLRDARERGAEQTLDEEHERQRPHRGAAGEAPDRDEDRDVGCRRPRPTRPASATRSRACRR